MTAARLLLNWGVLAVLVAAVLVVRYRMEMDARTPLPPPSVQLPAAQARQWQAFPSYRGAVPVLLYHGVTPARGSFSIRSRYFAQQMMALKLAGFHTITLDQYVSYVQGIQRWLPSRPILITFDGGRLDTYRAVNGILREYGFHAALFTFAAWPVAHPSFSLTWSELRDMQESGTWSVQENGGRGQTHVMYDAAGSQGGVYAFRQYVRGGGPGRGRLESFPSFAARTTSSIAWGEHQFAVNIPGYRPLAFAIPAGNYGQLQTNDPRIPEFVLPWLRKHFQVVFGGDYLDQGHDAARKIMPRFSRILSYRISVNPGTSLPVLGCRLRDWVTRAPIWSEYRCLRLRRLAR